MIHFAGLKTVGKSVNKPLKYYENNVGGTVTLLELMEEFKANKIVFNINTIDIVSQFLFD